MITVRCLTLPLPRWGTCRSLLLICRVVVMLAVVVLVVVLALRGYLPGVLVGPVLILVADPVWTVDWLVGVQRARAVLALPA
jgi:hypothetical protein